MEKKVIVIAAVSQDGVYGKGDMIPWKIPAEMRHFKEQTTGHTVVMGRRTWESLPPKFRPLPNRDNMIVTNTPEYVAEGASIVKSVQQAFETAKTEKVFLIGGYDIWYYGMSVADEALITEVRKDFNDGSLDLRVAHELLHPDEKWGYSLEGSRFDNSGDIPFVINRWARKKK